MKKKKGKISCRPKRLAATFRNAPALAGRIQIAFVASFCVHRRIGLTLKDDTFFVGQRASADPRAHRETGPPPRNRVKRGETSLVRGGEGDADKTGGKTPFARSCKMFKSKLRFAKIAFFPIFFILIILLS